MYFGAASLDRVALLSASSREVTLPPSGAQSVYRHQKVIIKRPMNHFISKPQELCTYIGPLIVTGGEDSRICLWVAGGGAASAAPAAGSSQQQHRTASPDRKTKEIRFKPY